MVINIRYKIKILFTVVRDVSQNPSITLPVTIFLLSNYEIYAWKRKRKLAYKQAFKTMPLTIQDRLIKILY
jgi:hypothetical protein